MSENKEILTKASQMGTIAIAGAAVVSLYFGPLVWIHSQMQRNNLQLEQRMNSRMVDIESQVESVENRVGGLESQVASVDSKLDSLLERRWFWR